MRRVEIVALASVTALLAVAGCGSLNGSVHTSLTAWPSFTGTPVREGAAIYVSGIGATGKRSVWLSESWITRGHSHSGLFESDGAGASWHQVFGWDGWPFWQRHFDSSHALVLAEFEERDYRLHPRLLSTRDGGVHWSAGDLPVTSIYGWSGLSVDFVDPDNGWLMVDLSGQFGRCVKAKQGVAIYRTRDGGASWVEIARVDQQHPDAQGLSIDGGKAGLSFRNGLDGYLTTSDPISGNTVFFTEDAGASWKRQTLPIDAGRGTAWISPPDWIGTEVGLMSVKISPPTMEPCLLGSPSPEPPQSSPSPHPWDVEPPASIVVPYPGEVLLATQNGGRAWSVMPASSSWGSVDSLAAADEVDWAVASSSDLWKTADGGSTWQVNRSVLQSGCDFGVIGFADRLNAWASALCTKPGPVIQGCPQQGDYASEWDCPPLSLPLLSTHDGGSTWTETDKPALN